MMVAISKLQPSQTVWELRKQKANGRSRTALFSLRIVSVDLEKNTVVASWNSNPPMTYHDKSIRKWKAKRPEPKRINLLGEAVY